MKKWCLVTKKGTTVILEKKPKFDCFFQGCYPKHYYLCENGKRYYCDVWELKRSKLNEKMAQA